MLCMLNNPGNYMNNLFSSWLHQNATVTTVESTNENTLQVSAVISMTNFAKYNAKFHSNT